MSVLDCIKVELQHALVMTMVWISASQLKNIYAGKGIDLYPIAVFYMTYVIGAVALRYYFQWDKSIF